MSKEREHWLGGLPEEEDEDDGARERWLAKTGRADRDRDSKLAVSGLPRNGGERRSIVLLYYGDPGSKHSEPAGYYLVNPNNLTEEEIADPKRVLVHDIPLETAIMLRDTWAREINP